MASAPSSTPSRMTTTESFKLLLEKGADVSKAVNYAGCPLRAAAMRGHEPTVRLLVEHGLDLDEEFPLIEALKGGHKDVAKLLVEKGANVNAVQGFLLKDGFPFWLYALPTTRRLAKFMSRLHNISNLCNRPKKRDLSKRQEYVWEDSPLWVAAALGDQESVKLLLDYGADPEKPSGCGMTPLDIATAEEHEAVVQQLLATITGSQSRAEDNEDKEPESPAEVEPSNPRLESAPGREPEVSPEAPNNAQPAQPVERGSEVPQPQDPQIRYPAYIQPADSSIDIDSSNQQQVDSSSRHPTFPYPQKSRGLHFVLEYADGQKEALDLLDSLSKAKADATAKGDKKFGNISSVGEGFMQNPRLIRIKLLKGGPLEEGWNSNDEEEVGGGEVEEEEGQEEQERGEVEDGEDKGREWLRDAKFLDEPSFVLDGGFYRVECFPERRASLCASYG